MAMLTADPTVPGLLRAQASRLADQPCLQIVDGPALSYGELWEGALSVARGLRRLGVEAGDRVVIMSPNTADAIQSWIGVNVAGAVEVAINTAYRGRPLMHVLANAGARVVFVHHTLVAVLAEVEQDVPGVEVAVVYGGDAGRSAAGPLRRIRALPYEEMCADGGEDPSRAVAPRDIASVIYTSGTTGPAKGVLMPHAQVHLLAQTTVDGLRMGGDDVYYCFHPMFHMAGKFMAVLATFMAGGTLVLDARFAPERWLERIRRYRATLTLAHGPMIEMIHAQPERPDDATSELRAMVAAPLPARIAEAFERRFGVRAIEVWGMTEVNVPCWQPYDKPLRVGSCGRVRDDLYELRLVDPDSDEEVPRGSTGELVVRPRRPWTMMQGYLDAPAETAAAWRNLWFHTGDLGRMDEDGYVYFVDRVKERIRRRAENVSSYEIESCAGEHPAVAECAAVGVPSEFESDDDVKLCVALCPDARFDPQELLVYLTRRLPHHMVPRYIEVLAGLPRTPTNKVRKTLLRDAGVTESTWDRKAAGISLLDLVPQPQAPDERAHAAS